MGVDLDVGDLDVEEEVPLLAIKVRTTLKCSLLHYLDNHQGDGNGGGCGGKPFS